jgi:hypothetical protein
MTTTKISGVLTYYGWTRPWEIEEERPGRLTHDLREEFWNFAEANKKALASQDAVRDSYSLACDPTSTRAIDFAQRGGGILVSETVNFGFTNVASYLGGVLMGLNARHVIATISPARFHIRADPDHLNVPAVEYRGEGKMSVGPEGFETSLCRAGQGRDCCIFLMVGAGGFECAKFDGSVAEHLVERKMLGTMNAGRIGNCRNAGRQPSDKEQTT